MSPEDWSNVVLAFEKAVYKAIKDALFYTNEDEEEYLEYSEYNFENENEQAFLDAGHFYGIG